MKSNINARKYFLNEYILPAAVVGTINSDNNFVEPYISLNDLIQDIQNMANEAASAILNAPDEDTKYREEITWGILFDILTKLQKV